MKTAVLNATDQATRSVSTANTRPIAVTRAGTTATQIALFSIAVRIDGVDMKFKYEDAFPKVPSTGYETLIYDCMLGDPTLFQRADTIEAGWRVMQPVLDAWKQEAARELPVYEAGGSGPREADELLARDGRRWRAIAENGNGGT